MRALSPFFNVLSLAALALLPPLRADFGRYQIILDRNLLGAPPQVARPPAPEPVVEEPRATWANEYRMTMITFDEFTQTHRIGLQNQRDQSGFLLIEGEAVPFDGNEFKLLHANFQDSKATVSFRGQTHVFSLESGTTTAAEPPPVQARNVRRVAQPPRRVNPRPPEPQPEPEPEEPPQSRFNSPEELEAHLQNVQMDAIRTGKPPLPIPLTPEMDAQLVQEGVLPPQ